MSLLLDALNRAQRDKGSNDNLNQEQNVDEPQNASEDDLQTAKIVDMEGLELGDAKPDSQAENVGLGLSDDMPTPKPDVIIDEKEDETSKLPIQDLPADLEIETENSVDTLECEPSLQENLAELDLEENKVETKKEEITAEVSYDSLTLEQVHDKPTSDLSSLESVDESLSDINFGSDEKQIEPDLSLEINEQKTEQSPDVIATTKPSEAHPTSPRIGAEIQIKTADKKASIEKLLEKNKKRKRTVSTVAATLISLIISFSGYYYYVGQLSNIEKIDDKFTERSLTPIGAVPPEEVDIFEAELSNSVTKIKSSQENISSLEKKPITTQKKVKVSEKRKRVIKQKVDKRSRTSNKSLVKKKKTPNISRNVVTKKENEETPVHTLLISAFNAFQLGNDEVASKNYLFVLEIEKNNRNALLGLGAIAVRQKKLDLARNYYTQILKKNQSDSVARAALVGLVGQLDPIKAETELKLMLKNKPGAGYLHFALGNIYAIQQRWLEAQKAFFNAHRTDENNPDYTYNIAVSLDHLGEPKQAVKFYREALSFSQNTKVSFQSHQVKKRIDALVNSRIGENR